MFLIWWDSKCITSLNKRYYFYILSHSSLSLDFSIYLLLQYQAGELKMNLANIPKGEFVEMKLSAVTDSNMSGQWGQESCSAHLAQEVGVCCTWQKAGKGQRRDVFPRKMPVDMLQALLDLVRVSTSAFITEITLLKIVVTKNETSL